MVFGLRSSSQVLAQVKLMESYTNRHGETIRVGSIIKAYRPGYHIVTSIVDRRDIGKYSTDSPLIHYMPLLTSKGTKAAKSPQSCDAAYCSLASRRLPEEIKQLEEHIAALKKFQSDYDF